MVVVSSLSIARLSTLNDEVSNMVNDKFPKTIEANNIIDGINQIARGADPRSLGLGEITAFFWSTALLLYWLWMVLLLIPPFGRVHGLSLLTIALIGFSLRRGTGLKWVLVILTFEGAIRIGLLLSLCVMAWRRF